MSILPQIFNRTKPEDPGDHFGDPADLQEHYEALLLQQSLIWKHAGQQKCGHIERIVESPYPADRGSLVALWYSDEDLALDYIPVEAAWELVVSQ